MRARPSGWSAKAAPANPPWAMRCCGWCRRSGGIRFDGADLAELDKKRLRRLRADMQIVFQDPFGSLSPRMTVAEIVAEGLSVHEPSLTRQERGIRVAVALEEVGLRDRYRRPLPARVQRRPAAAHRDRTRHGAEAAVRGAGRTDQCAGYVGAGADRRSAAATAGATINLAICSSVTICGWFGRWRIASWCCGTAGWSSKARRTRCLPGRSTTTRGR